MNTIEIENQLGLTFSDRLEIAFVRGAGSYVWDEAGRRYLDFTSGWGVTCLGHSHPVVVSSIQNQAARLMQNPNAGFTYSPSRAALMGVLKTVVPDNLARFYFVNSGAEANDMALKLARKITGKSRVVSTRGAFHGRTFNTLAVSRGEDNMRRYSDAPSATVFVPFGDLDALAGVLSGENDIAAVIVEPVQGEGGVQVPAPGYLAQVQSLCRQYSVLLIVDEIQTGFCRTGTFFALEQGGDGIAPDFLTMGKGIAGGFPFAAVAASEAVAAKLEKDDHGGTYCGNPLGCAVSTAVVSYLRDQGVAARVADSGALLLTSLQTLVQRYPDLVRGVRGAGLLCALELRDHRHARTLTLACAEQGLLVVPTRNGVVRLIPDLLVSHDDIHRACDLLSGAIAGLRDTARQAVVA